KATTRRISIRSHTNGKSGLGWLSNATSSPSNSQPVPAASESVPTATRAPQPALLLARRGGRTSSRALGTLDPPDRLERSARGPILPNLRFGHFESGGDTWRGDVRTRSTRRSLEGSSAGTFRLRSRTP